MRLRTLLAATAASVLTLGLTGAVTVPAHAAAAPSPTNAGQLVTWGNEAHANGGAAIPIPADVAATAVRSVSANAYATGVATLDGGVRVWGKAGRSEVGLAPTDVTDATAIALAGDANGAVLHADGQVTAWGDSALLSEVPEDLRAKAIALLFGGTGYAVRTDGTLAHWGAPPAIAPPPGLTNLVDVSAYQHALALHEDGTVTIWGPVFADLLTVPDFGGKKAVEIATGPLYSGVVFEDGTIDIWGPGTPAGEPVFDGLTPATKVVSLSLGPANALALTADGVVHHWGSNALIHAIPEALAGEPVSAVAIGTTHAAAVITAFRDLTKPTISGTAKTGQTLTATPATYSLTPDSTTGQWYAGNEPIAGKTGTTLVLDSAQVGKSISYRQTATRGEDTVESASAAVGPVTYTTTASSTTLSVDRADAAVGTTRTVTATVAKAGGTPTGSVTFALGSTTATAALTAGKAVWTLPSTLPVGTHQVTASYAGDATTDPSTATAVAVTVAKADATVMAKAKAEGKTKGKGKGKKVATKVTITITVKTAPGISPAGKVTVTLKGKTRKTVSAKVDARGKATVTVKRLKRGKYTAVVKYAGNGSVNAATGRATFRA